MIDVLAKLFGSASKVKIMRLFLSNPEEAYDNKMVASKAHVSSDTSRKVINQLRSIGLIKSKVFLKDTEVKRRGKKVVAKKKVRGWILDNNFPYTNSLSNLLIQGRPTDTRDLLRRIKPTGRLQLVITSGVFIKNPDSRVDLLVVGDRLKRNALDKVIGNLEAEIGKELIYAVFDTDEFAYRMNVYDKLILDILEYPHEKILNKLGL